MHTVWLLGVFIFLARPGQASPGFEVSCGWDGSPQIASVPRPEYASLEPLVLPDLNAAYARRPVSGPVGRRKHRSKPAFRPSRAAAGGPEPHAHALMEAPAALAEFERLGEDLRDAVAPVPTLEWFLESLRDPDPARRRVAVETMGYPDNVAAVPYLGAVLLRLDEEVPVRAAAARAMGRVGDRRAASFLAQSVGDGDPRIRADAATALGMVSGSAGAAVLSRAMSREPDESVRMIMSWALEKARLRGY